MWEYLGPAQSQGLEDEACGGFKRLTSSEFYMKKLTNEIILIYYYSHYMIRKQGKLDIGESNLGVVNLTYSLIIIHFFTLILIVFRFIPIEIIRLIFATKIYLIVYMILIIYGVVLIHELIYRKEKMVKYEELFISGEIECPKIGGYYVVLIYILSIVCLVLAFLIGVVWR